MGHIRIRGIILRLVNFKDYDRYLKILTQDQGVLSVYARRIRSQKSKFGSRCQLFSFADFDLFENKGNFSLNDVETVYTFPKLQKDILRITAASELAEIILDNTHEQKDSQALYHLFVRACYELDKEKKDPIEITNLAELKMMNILGFQPQLSVCRSCQLPPAPEENLYFDYRNASLYCNRHGAKKQQEYQANVHPLSRDLLALLRYQEQCPLEKTFQLVLTPGLIEELSQFVSRYLAERFDKDYDKFQIFRDFALPSEGL